MDLCSAYQAMPQKNCGICGYASCSTFLRNVVFNRESLEKCHWLKCGYPLDVTSMQTLVQTVQPIITKVRTTALIEPCTTQSGMVMAELYLAHREVEYGYLDPVVCDILPVWTEAVRCSRQLGIARIEYEQKEILLSVTGKTVIRHAKNEEDISRTGELLSRIVEGAVICSCLSTRMECISGGGTRTDSVPPSTLEERSQLQCINDVAERVPDMYEAPSCDLGSLSLRRQAVALMVFNKGGLLLLSVAHHLSLLEVAVKDLAEHNSALVKERVQKEVTAFIETALTGNADTTYHDLCTFLLQEQPPLYKELHNVIFHVHTLSKIREQYLT
ncbi:MAG: (Fe-S)-binding protein [Candidatus Methanofastidiosia archaeon]